MKDEKRAASERFSAIVDRYGQYVPAHTIIPDEYFAPDPFISNEIIDEDNEKKWELQACANIIHIINLAHVASEQEIKEEIKSLSKMIGTKYYDGKGGILIQQAIKYLQSYLEISK